MTDAEKKIWDQCLRLLPVRVVRQRAIDRFIVDFYCASKGIVIEIDESGHVSPDSLIRDGHRRKILEGYGLTIIRFTNDEVTDNFEAVCGEIRKLLCDPIP